MLKKKKNDLAGVVFQFNKSQKLLFLVPVVVFNYELKINKWICNIYIEIIVIIRETELVFKII